MQRTLTRVAGIAAAAILLSAPCRSHAIDDLCDRSLPSPVGDALGYRDRGDRCEGRFVKEVGNTTLLVASLTATFDPGDLAAPDARVSVAWPPLTGASTDTRIRAQSLKRRQYYRMDTRRPADAKGFEWPGAMLASLEIGPKDWGIVVSTTARVGPIERVVLLPARIPARSAAVPRTYELVVVPGAQLDELSFAVVALSEDGTSSREVVASMPLRYGFYPAERAIAVPLPLAAFEARGLYRIELVARLSGGGASRADAWLFHPGP